MQISLIRPTPARGGSHEFSVVFDTGVKIQVNAGQLQNYSRFQRKVLEMTGAFFRFGPAEVARIGQREWGRHVSYLLTQAQPAEAGQGAGERPRPSIRERLYAAEEEEDMSAAWKNLERQSAKALNGKRNTRGGDFSKSMPDVEHPLFTIEVKYRKALPRLLRLGLEQAQPV